LAALLLPIALVSSITIAACSSPTSGASCETYVVPASFDPTKPTVSFTSDVLPIFEASCGLSTSCHGAQTGPRIFLGSRSTPFDPMRVLGDVVGVPSSDLPAMNYVTAGDPSQSFLMHKMDGDQCMLTAKCANNDCGLSMPQNNDVLEVAKRDVVRRWIAQGAQNN
jgi:hypothetical protein